MPRGDSYQLQGLGGAVVLDGSTSDSFIGDMRWIQVVNDAVITTLTADPSFQDPDKLQGVTLPAGLGLGGHFTGILLQQGIVIAYKM